MLLKLGFYLYSIPWQLLRSSEFGKPALVINSLFKTQKLNFSTRHEHIRCHFCWEAVLSFYPRNKICCFAFIHSGYLYSASSSRLLLRGAPNTLRILWVSCRSATGNCEWRTCPRSLHGGKSRIRTHDPSDERQWINQMSHHAHNAHENINLHKCACTKAFRMVLLKLASSTFYSRWKHLTGCALRWWRFLFPPRENFLKYRKRRCS